MRAIWGLMALAVLATAGWGGYWFVGARALDGGVARLLATNPALSAREHMVRGFPNRFDLTLTEPRYAEPGVLWQAPFVQVFALSYRPHHLVAVFAHDQRLMAGGLDVALHTEDMRASVVMEPGLALPLERFALVATAPVASLPDATHRADVLRLASRALGAGRHQVAIEIEHALADPGVMEALDPRHHWPRRFDVLRLDAEVSFDRPLDRHALNGPLPVPVDIALTGARIAWDGVRIDAVGRLAPDALGRLSGEVTLSVQGWRALMERARDAGLMPPEHDLLMSLALQSMVDPADPERLVAPITLREGQVMLGPVILGLVPPLY